MGKISLNKLRENKKYLFIIALVIVVICLVILFNLINTFQKPELTEEEELPSLSPFVEDGEFIFSFWPIYLNNPIDANLTALDDMMNTGMTHAVVSFRPESNAEQYLSQIREKYKLALEIDAGHLSYGGLPELVYGQDDNKFLDASCLNKTKCERWNYVHAIDPSYTGELWQNTVKNTLNTTKRASPDIVFFDTEIWLKPEIVERYFTVGDPGGDCNCKIIEQGIGYEAYNQNWLQRGLNLKEAVKQVTPSAEVYFYNEILENKRWIQNYNGEAILSDWLPVLGGTGDYPSPSLYVLPNLEIFEKNIEDLTLSEAVPWVSFTYFYGYSNYNAGDIYFDSSVSREAGRMLRKAGARGFIVYPNAFNSVNRFNGKGYDYWLEHAREMILGFKEGLNYIEKNKIKNPDFEAFKTKAGYKYIGGEFTLVNMQFAPVFWRWSDSNLNYEDNPTFANLTYFDKKSGTVAWRHTRLGDIGNRTIYSHDFSIDSDESGHYNFSIWAKTSINSNNSKIKFYLVNTGESEEKIGEISFNDNWKKFEKNISISPGNYKIKIIIEDNTNRIVNIFFDNSLLMKIMEIKITCGNGVCEEGENCTQDGSGAEICDGIDNDCNGNVDEKLIASLNSKQGGVCLGSRQLCIGAGGWVENYSSIADYEVREESCDDLDNDCDGEIDESCGEDSNGGNGNGNGGDDNITHYPLQINQTYNETNQTSINITKKEPSFAEVFRFNFKKFVKDYSLYLLVALLATGLLIILTIIIFKIRKVKRNRYIV